MGVYSASGSLLIFAHDLAVTFDIGTEYGRELTLEVFCSHANTSLKRWRRQDNERLELSIARGSKVQRYGRLRMSKKARLDLLQIRGRRRLLSSERTILRLFGRVLERKRSECRLHPLIHTSPSKSLAQNVAGNQNSKSGD